MCVYVCVCMCVCLYVCLYVRYVYRFVFIAYVFKCIFALLYIFVIVYVYVYIYIYIYMFVYTVLMYRPPARLGTHTHTVQYRQVHPALQGTTQYRTAQHLPHLQHTTYLPSDVYLHRAVSLPIHSRRSHLALLLQWILGTYSTQLPVLYCTCVPGRWESHVIARWWTRGGLGTSAARGSVVFEVAEDTA